MTNLKKTIEQIEKDMASIGGLKKVKIHIQNFENQKDESYIEFEALSPEYEEIAGQLYSKYSKIIRKNHPEISIAYNNPKFQHSESLLRRILINVNHDTKDPTRKRELFTQAAKDFHYIVKRWPIAREKRKNKHKR